MAPETESLDVLTIGEMVVDFISVEKTDTLSYATTFRRYLGGSPANIAVYVSMLGGTSAVVAKPSLEDARRLFDVNMDEETAISEFHDLSARSSSSSRVRAASSQSRIMVTWRASGQCRR
jgi:sugar/nucleoside kinase (ribokinase family)